MLRNLIAWSPRSDKASTRPRLCGASLTERPVHIELGASAGKIGELDSINTGWKDRFFLVQMSNLNEFIDFIVC